jgi:hypothetical protein
MTTINPPKELIPYFTFFENHARLGAPKWIITCKKCGFKWSRRIEEIPVGAKLTLFDHAHSHKPEATS